MMSTFAKRARCARNVLAIYGIDLGMVRRWNLAHQEKVVDLLLDARKIDLEVAVNMRAWRHSGLTATIPVAALRAAKHHIRVL